ncbi:hypothetical protein L6R52_30520, partial [Myxococcota bacterium]|nr:hypothetical protein [Myxococcota bacterium]
TATGTAALPGAHAATTAASSTRASSPSPDRSRPRATRDGAPAIVSFGTRSCSSRVSVDGVVVARSTPTYDHALEPGAHTITIEGTSCPPIERPGSLRATIPTVVRTLDVPAGARLKLIADFERGVLLVR